MNRLRTTRAVALVAFSCLCGRTVRAHEGPPFPVIVDQVVGPYTASLWADPDIGIGTFYIVLTRPEGGDVPTITRAEVIVEPASGRLPAAVYGAQAQEVGEGARYIAEVPFDRGDWCRVRVRLDGVQGGGELIGEVESTPDDGLGPIGLAVYSMPFIAIGLLWAKAMRRRKVSGSR